MQIIFLWRSYYPVGNRPTLEQTDSSGLQEDFTSIGKTGSRRLVKELGIEIWIEFVYEEKRWEEWKASVLF